MRLTSSLWLALTLTLAFCSACVHTQETRPLVSVSEPRPRVLVVQDARVFPATGADVVLEHHDVIVEGGRIAAVRPTGAPLPAGALVVDGRKRTLLPGLVDAHSHTQVTGAPPWYRVAANPAHVLEEALYAGITTTHDMGGRLDEALVLRARVASGALLAPRLRIAGPFFTAPGGYPESYISRIVAMPDVLKTTLLAPYLVRADHPREARRAVLKLADAGVDHIKVALASTPDQTPVLDALVLEAITDAAHQRGLKVMAHIDTGANARFAVEHGVDALVHGVHSTELSDDDARAIGARHTLVVPTLLTFERLWQLSSGKLALTPMEQETVASNLQRSLVERPAGDVLDADLAKWLKHLDEHRDARLHANVKKLHDAGARILVGTDGHGSTGSFPAGIHEEMRLLVEAGIPNNAVLMGATAWSAHLSDPSPSYGTIEIGKDADLLLVEGNPLEDITATARIVQIVLDGRPIVRATP